VAGTVVVAGPTTLAGAIVLAERLLVVGCTLAEAGAGKLSVKLVSAAICL
jgi:hypothetical protein